MFRNVATGLGLAAVLLLAPRVRAEEGETTEQRLQRLEKRNQELENRVRELEQKEAVVSGDPEALKTAVDEYLAGREEEVDGADEGGIGLNIVLRRNNVVATLQIFGDVGYRYENPTLSSVRGNNSFFLGSVDFFFTAQVGDHFQVLSETVLKTSFGADTDSVRWDQERLWGAWTFSDSLYVKFGLEHNDISRWNRLYHHGRWLQTSITRPFLARFESSGWLPMHNAGVEFGGRLPSGIGSFEYTVIVANGRGSVATDPQKVSDRNQNKSLDLGLSYAPKNYAGLRVGLHGRVDDIPPLTGVAARSGTIRQLIGSGYVQYVSARIELMSEFAYIEDRDHVSGSTFKSNLAYLQIAYNIDDSWTPYLRIDYRNIASGDPYYAQAGRSTDAWEIPLGIRYNLEPNAALTLELAYGRREDSSFEWQTYFRLAVQLSWVF